MADVCITEYTDPGCPWAYSAEPFRRRLSWLYGDALEWRVRMVGLAESPDEYVERGFTPERQSRAFATIARDHGMPIDTSVRPRMAATMPACRAVVAARLHAPERMRALLRRLRVRHFAGDLLDEPGDDRGRRPRRRHRPRRPRTLDRRRRRRGGAARRHGRVAAPDRRRPRARREARQLVGRAALHVPELRDRARRGRREDRGARVPAVRRLRRRDGEPRAGRRPAGPGRSRSRRSSRGPARRWRRRRSRWCATSASPRRGSAWGARPSRSTSARTASGRSTARARPRAV